MSELKKNTKIIHEHLDFLREAYHVKHIGVFGSVARGRHTRRSDLDILIELSQPMGFFRFLELEEFLGKVLKRKVDLVTKNALKSAVKKEVLKDVVYV